MTSKEVNLVMCSCLCLTICFCTSQFIPLDLLALFVLLVQDLTAINPTEVFALLPLVIMNNSCP